MTLEVDRLKKRLAAKENDEDLLTFLFRDHAAESSYVDDLKQRIRYRSSLISAFKYSDHSLGR